VIDGKDIWPLLAGEAGATSPHEAFFYYYLAQLQAVRSGRWKLYLPLERKWVSFGRKTRTAKAELYDLAADLAETTNLAEQHPEVVQRLLALAEEAREDLGDAGRKGKGQRPAGLVESPTPRTLSRG
jgi:arylsulfatase A-like enzyme